MLFGSFCIVAGQGVWDVTHDLKASAHGNISCDVATGVLEATSFCCSQTKSHRTPVPVGLYGDFSVLYPNDRNTQETSQRTTGFRDPARLHAPAHKRSKREGAVVVGTLIVSNKRVLRPP